MGKALGPSRQQEVWRGCLLSRDTCPQHRSGGEHVRGAWWLLESIHTNCLIPQTRAPSGFPMLTLLLKINEEKNNRVPNGSAAEPEAAGVSPCGPMAPLPFPAQQL